MFENVLNPIDRRSRGHLIGVDPLGRRGRRRQAEAAEVAEIDRWLEDMRNGPELVLYSAHPTTTTAARSATGGRGRHGKKHRR